MLDPVRYARAKKERKERAAHLKREAELASMRQAMLARIPSVRGLLLHAWYDAQDRKRQAREAEAEESTLTAEILRFLELDGLTYIRRVRTLDTLSGVGVELRKGDERKALAKRLRKLLPERPRLVIQDHIHLDGKRYVRSPVGYGRDYMNKQENQWQDRRADRLSLAAHVLDERGDLRRMTYAEEHAWVESVAALPIIDRGGLIVSWIKMYDAPTVWQLARWYAQINDLILGGRFGRELDALESAYAHWGKAWAGTLHAEQPRERPIAPASVARYVGTWHAASRTLVVRRVGGRASDTHMIDLATYGSWSQARAALGKGRIEATMKYYTDTTRKGMEDER